MGIPGTWTWPGWGAIFANIWNESPEAKAFPPKVFGYGWSINFAYPTIRGKPLWARVAMFILSLAIILFVAWALIALILVLYYLATPA